MRQHKSLVFTIAMSVTLVLVAAFLLVERDFVRANIVSPLLYLVWVTNLLLQSTPQGIFWFIGLVVTLVVLVRSLGILDKPHIKLVELPSRLAGQKRIAYWARQIDLARRKKIRMSFGEQVGKLVLEVISFQAQKSSREVDDLWMDGNLDLPPAIHTFLQARSRTSYPSFGGLFSEWLHRMRGEQTAYSYSEKELASAIRYLEEQVEVKEK